MSRTPSRADRQLAIEATDSGYPTTAEQVRYLGERRSIPPSKVVRRGRGVTESKYPPGALAVLLALRQAMADEPARHYRALVLAWVRGAAVPDEALRPALLRMVDDADQLAQGVVKPPSKPPHRRVRQDTHRAALAALAALQLGHIPTSEGVEALADTFAPFIAGLADRSSADASPRVLPPGGVRDELIASMSGGHLARSTDSHSESAQEVANLLSGEASRYGIKHLPREALDRERDRARRMLGIGRSLPSGAAPTGLDIGAEAITLGLIGGALRQFKRRYQPVQITHRGRVTLGYPGPYLG
jgi:hypothetical protein